MSGANRMLNLVWSKLDESKSRSGENLIRVNHETHMSFLLKLSRFGYEQ